MFGVRKEKPNVSLTLAWQAEIGDHVIALAWSPDGSQLATASVAGPITVFHSGTGKVRQKMAGHGFGTTSLSWQPQGQSLASSGQDGKVRSWHPAAGREQFAAEGGNAWVERVAWSPDGKLLASSAGKLVRLWDESGRMYREWTDFPSTVVDLQWKPGANELATAAYGELRVLRPALDKAVRTFTWKGSILVLAWDPLGKFIATGDQDSTVHFWILKNGEDLMMSGYETKVRELAWDYTGRWLATGGGAVPCVWDTSGSGPADTTPAQLKAHEDQVTSLAYQHRGPLLASGGADGLVAVWNPGKSSRSLATVDLGFPITKTAWSMSDQKLAVATESGRVAVYSLKA